MATAQQPGKRNTDIEDRYPNWKPVQTADAITPRFVPAQQRQSGPIIPAGYTEPAPRILPIALPAQPVLAGKPKKADDDEPFIRSELPGPQRLFQRDSEGQFFDRLAQKMKKADGSRAIFPEEPEVSKAAYRPRNFPRMVEVVEPSYVCHARLYWEQPNFERLGYNFGYLQPALCLGIFYYDTAMFPYHYFSDLRTRYDCTHGKCLPGDPAPLLVPCERFSVTGLVGQSGAMFGLGFIMP
jgi:hypothetical protein